MATGLEVVEAALAGDSQRALDALGRSRLLCAHRLGPAGVSTWNARIEAWLADEIEQFSPDGTWYVGRPVVVTANDYGIRLYNGDTGVAVARKGTASEDRLGVAFASWRAGCAEPVAALCCRYGFCDDDPQGPRVGSEDICRIGSKSRWKKRWRFFFLSRVCFFPFLFQSRTQQHTHHLLSFYLRTLSGLYL